MNSPEFWADRNTAHDAASALRDIRRKIHKLFPRSLIEIRRQEIGVPRNVVENRFQRNASLQNVHIRCETRFRRHERHHLTSLTQQIPRNSVIPDELRILPMPLQIMFNEIECTFAAKSFLPSIRDVFDTQVHAVRLAPNRLGLDPFLAHPFIYVRE